MTQYILPQSGVVQLLPDGGAPGGLREKQLAAQQESSLTPEQDGAPGVVTRSPWHPQAAQGAAHPPNRLVAVIAIVGAGLIAILAFAHRVRNSCFAAPYLTLGATDVEMEVL